MKRFASAILFFLVGAAIFAYNPPSDTAGPLTVQMQPPAVGAYGAGGYADLARAGVPFVVPVSLQNAGDRAITGTLRMAAIDGWKVAPAGALPFQIGPHGRLRREFTLSFPPATYNAHYPIHVYAEFEWGGQKLVAHPVMLVQPRIPDLPRPKLPVEWKPVPDSEGRHAGAVAHAGAARNRGAGKHRSRSRGGRQGSIRRRKRDSVRRAGGERQRAGRDRNDAGSAAAVQTGNGGGGGRGVPPGAAGRDALTSGVPYGRRGLIRGEGGAGRGRRFRDGI